MLNPLEFLAMLQAESENGFNRNINAWVDDNSGVARALTEMANW